MYPRRRFNDHKHPSHRGFREYLPGDIVRKFYKFECCPQHGLVCRNHQIVAQWNVDPLMPVLRSFGAWVKERSRRHSWQEEVSPESQVDRVGIESLARLQQGANDKCFWAINRFIQAT